MIMTNRTILITGGSAGIGLAFARRFLELDNTVIVTGRKQEALDKAQVQNPGLIAIRCDSADPEEVAALAARVKREWPRLDVLMNNAGFAAAQNLSVPSDNIAALTAEMDTNFGGVVRLTSALIDLLVANKGTIINVSSALAFVPLPAMPVYCASKAAVHSYTQSLRFQLERSGVEVIELMPPAVKTDLAEGFEEVGIKTMPTAELVERTIVAFRAGKSEIRPGQANLLAAMRRIAPDFIGRQLWESAKSLIPAAQS